MTWEPIATAPKDGTWIVAVGRLRHDQPVMLRACITRWVQKSDPPVFAEGWLYSAPGYVDLFEPRFWVPCGDSTHPAT